MTEAHILEFSLVELRVLSGKFFDISLRKKFLDIPPQARETTAKIIEWDDINLKGFTHKCLCLSVITGLSSLQKII